MFCLPLFSLALSGCQLVPAPEPDPAPEPAPQLTELQVPDRPLVLSTSTFRALCPGPQPQPKADCPPPSQSVCPACPAGKLDGKMLVGEVELVKVSPPGITYRARIDTGATGTSVHATDVVRFERDGQRWVRFQLDNPDGDPITLEREVQHRVRIIQASVEDDKYESRYVVLLTLTIGSRSKEIEVSLSDRANMEYSILVGRDFLRNDAVVDVGQQMIAK